ncbi:MAG: HAD family hydrolase [Candidatus Rokubacteria bacterium]|nr:HAD family hydrolase [Candidatus Rokubacteria bacterium]
MTRAPRRAVFLDRDGVLNRVIVRAGRPYPPSTPAELEVLPEAPGAVAALRAAGFLLIGVTNQPDVRRGTQSREVVERINAALLAALPGLTEIVVCYHDDGDACACRKPRPGLLTQAASRHGIDLASSFMVGDRWKDVEAGRRAGCTTIWIDCRYSERGPGVAADYTVRSLSEATEWILDHPVARHETRP